MLRHCLWQQIVAVVVAAMSGLCGVSLCPAAGMTLEELIEVVRQNELLFHDIDVTMRMDYEVIGRGALVKPDDQAPFRLVETLEEHSRHRYVAQGDLYLSDRRTTIRNEAETREDVPFVAAFDGETTRLLFDRVGNIAKGRLEKGMPILPHTLLLEAVEVPLSVYLEGGDAVRRHPRGLKSEAVKASVKGEEDCCNLRCLKVSIEAGKVGEDPAARWDVWLAVDRHYIPARAECRRYWISTTVPTGQGRVVEWREVKPGIWFPSRTLTTTIRADLLQLDGRQVPNWRKEYHLEAINLSPEFERSYFRFEFPPGTTVYELEGNKIKKGRRVGRPGDTTGAQRPRSGLEEWPVLFCLAAALATVAAVLLLRWRKTRHPQPAAGLAT